MYQVLQDYLDSKIVLTPEEAAKVRAYAIVKKLRKKQYLLQEGNVWQYDAFIAKGCLRTYTIDEKGREHIISFAAENWWTGDRESLLSGQPSRFNIDAIEDSEVILFTHSNFEWLCRDIPALNNLVHQLLQKSFVVSQHRIQATLSYTAEEKYQDFLNRYPAFANRIPQSMIAAYLGMTPETLSRVRNQASHR